MSPLEHVPCGVDSSPSSLQVACLAVLLLAGGAALAAEDRRVASLREHAIPMPMFWRVPPDEAAILCRSRFVHAFVSTGFQNPRHMLLRATLRTPAPCVAFVHSIPDQSAEMLFLLSGQTFPFDLLFAPSRCGNVR